MSHVKQVSYITLLLLCFLLAKHISGICINELGIACHLIYRNTSGSVHSSYLDVHDIINNYVPYNDNNISKTFKGGSIISHWGCTHEGGVCGQAHFWPKSA